MTFVVVCVLTLVVICLPVYWMVKVAIEPTSAMFLWPPKFFPLKVTLNGFVKLFADGRITLWLRNSLLVTFGALILELSVALPAAFAIARYRYKGKAMLLFLVLVTQMLPAPLLVVPLYVLLRSYRLIDSLLGLVLVDAGIALPLATWIMSGFFGKIPTEIFESAKVDGCSDLAVFWRIALPISAPAVLTVAALGFFSTWNEFLFAYTFISSPSKWTGSIGLSTFVGRFTTQWQAMMAASTIYVIIPLVIYFVLRRYIETGLAEGSIKG